MGSPKVDSGKQARSNGDANPRLCLQITKDILHSTVSGASSVQSCKGRHPHLRSPRGVVSRLARPKKRCPSTRHKKKICTCGLALSAASDCVFSAWQKCSDSTIRIEVAGLAASSTSTNKSPPNRSPQIDQLGAKRPPSAHLRCTRGV